MSFTVVPILCHPAFLSKNTTYNQKLNVVSLLHTSDDQSYRVTEREHGGFNGESKGIWTNNDDSASGASVWRENNNN